MAFSKVLCNSIASVLVAILAAFSTLVWTRLGPQPRELEPHTTTMIVSYDPLIIYMENFLKEEEVKHLNKVAETSAFFKSTVRDETGIEVPSEERTSRTSWLPHNDTVVQAVRSRAARFQGHLPTSHIEDLQVTKYQAGQQYTPHLDPVSGDGGTDRVTTIFAILADSCDGGEHGGGGHCGTQFPEVLIDWTAEDPRWCAVVDCAEKALTIRPRAGNAVFWRNRRDDGSIHPKALHAGLPIQEGVKIGLNIWTDGEPRWGDAKEDVRNR